jgi:hypothetical protein
MYVGRKHYVVETNNWQFIILVDFITGIDADVPASASVCVVASASTCSLPQAQKWPVSLANPYKFHKSS